MADTKTEKTEKALPPRQQRFVDEYLIDLNATQAAIRAGYSPKTAREQATKMLSKPRIFSAISIKMAERSRRTGINQDRIMEELAKMAFVKMTDVVDRNGRIRDDATDEDLACIESIKYKETVTDTGTTIEREVKIASKQKALELLGKHLGIYDTPIARELAKLRREEFEYRKEKEAGAFSEYEDLEDIEQEIYNDADEPDDSGNGEPE